MTVSIIVPVYNVSDYISDCLNSIISQTYSNIECIIVDDKSSDDSIAICNHIISAYSGLINFKIIYHETNRGLSAARNTGLRYASGSYVYFLDSDDWITPDCIEKLVSCIDKHPDSEIVFSGAVPTQDTSRYDWLNILTKDLPDYSDNQKWIKTAMLQRYTLSMTAWNRLVKKSFIIDNNLFFFEGQTHEDEIWNFDLAKYVSKATICHSNTYYYRIRNNSIIRKESLNSKARSLLSILDIMRDNIDGVLHDIQAKMIWQLIAETYYEPDLSADLHQRERDILLYIRKYLNFCERIVLIIYTCYPSAFLLLKDVPKIKGFINIQMRIQNKYSPICGK